jgi:hypothetical protein
MPFPNTFRATMEARLAEHGAARHTFESNRLARQVPSRKTWCVAESGSSFYSSLRLPAANWPSACSLSRAPPCEFLAEATMTPEDPRQHRDSQLHKRQRDWVYVGSLVLIALSLLGMALIAWSRYEPGG